MKNIGFIFAFILLWSCGNQENTTEEVVSTTTDNLLHLTDEQLKSFALTSTTLQEKRMTKTLRLNGEIGVPPQHLVAVSSALGGHIRSTKLLAGMSFKKGEILATMEDNQFIQLQQDYLTVKAQLENAEAEFQRQKELNENKASSDKVYLQAKADYETLRISKKSLEQKLRLIAINPNQLSVANISEKAFIYAPFDGYVSQVFIKVGQYVSPSEVLFELVNLNDLYLKLKVFERDFEQIELGQTLVAYSNGFPEKKYQGEIIQIGKTFSNDRAVEVYARLEETDRKLIPKMYMNAEIVIPATKTMAIPEESVVSFEGQTFVFEILDQNNFKMIEVQTKNAGDGWIEIENELKDKKIAQEGAYTLLMALKNQGEE